MLLSCVRSTLPTALPIVTLLFMQSPHSLASSSIDFVPALPSPSPPPMPSAPSVPPPSASSPSKSSAGAMASTDTILFDAHATEGAPYFTSPTSSAAPRQHSGNLRLHICASDLHDPSGRARAACAVLSMRTSKTLRAPAHLSNITEGTEDVAARMPTSSTTSSASSAGTGTRTPVGRTEVARVCGRDVEFARSFLVPYTAASVLRVDLYAVAPRGATRALGSTEVPLSRLRSRRGTRVTLPLAPPPREQGAPEKRRRAPAPGTLAICAEDVSEGLSEFRLDVQCEQMKRSKPFGSGRVRKAHYSVHTLTAGDEDCETWALLFRSEPVEMVKKKRDGGSMEYNYFSSRPLLATPGVIIAEAETEEPGSIVHRVQHKIKNRHDGHFFSLPSSSFSAVSPDRRLKLTVFDDSSAFSGPEIIADTLFTINELRGMKLGDHTEMTVHSNTVGEATIKFVECGERPKYFCLAIRLPDL